MTRPIADCPLPLLEGVRSPCRKINPGAPAENKSGHAPAENKSGGPRPRWSNSKSVFPPVLVGWLFLGCIFAVTGRGGRLWPRGLFPGDMERRRPVEPALFDRTLIQPSEPGHLVDRSMDDGL